MAAVMLQLLFRLDNESVFQKSQNFVIGNIAHSRYNFIIALHGTVLIGGGLGYFISYEVGSFLAQCINFPLQRNITFKSKGNPVYQAVWYFIAWVVISLICNGFNNLWMPIAAEYVSPAVYNILVTFITGGVSMIIFFFVFKIIFPEGETEKR